MKAFQRTYAKYRAVILIEKGGFIIGEYKFNFIFTLLACLSTFFIGFIARFFHSDINTFVLVKNSIICYCISAIIPIIAMLNIYSFIKFMSEIFKVLYFAITIHVWLIIVGFVISFIMCFILSILNAKSFNEFSMKFGENPLFVFEALINSLTEKVNPFFENLLSYFQNIPFLMIVFIFTMILHIVSFVSARRNCKYYNKNLFSFFIFKP